MDYYGEQFRKIHKELRQISAWAQRELSKAPEGRLLHHRENGRDYYRQAISSEKGYTRSGINRKKNLIVQLARKEYLEQMCMSAEANVQLLHEMGMRYQSMDPAIIIKKMSAAARSLPEQMILGTGALEQMVDRDKRRADRMKGHRQWAREEYEQSTYKPEEKIHLTTTGIYVRSKSEALIMEKLYDCGVPNRYEQILRIDGRSFAPDFTFRDAHGQPFYWEHAGMMGDIEYVRKHRFRMSEYERIGIVPWKNMIVTYDTEDGAINMGLIDAIVRFQVLPRL